ncbi:MAG: hypothetical protein U0704_14220 [Candidatus Eisenbacteria bacterium]
MKRPAFLAAALVLAVLAAPSFGATARNLGSVIQIDGYASEYSPDDSVFVLNETSLTLEEPWADSKWGVNNDVNQIFVTWDAKYLYFAVNGITWDNNMVLLIDSTPGRGLESMLNINSWKRRFVFDTTGSAAGTGFAPDLFGATWDGNTSPHLIIQQSGNTVIDAIVGPLFRASASFSKGSTGRAMEFAVPWQQVFLSSAQPAIGTKDTIITVGGVTDSIHVFPKGAKLKLVAVVTAGGDDTGGPDTAPDILGEITDQSSAQVYVDNWVIVDLDRNDDTGLGHGGPDGVADWGVSPHSRVSFRVRPPFVSKQFSASRIHFDRPAFRPDAGERLRYTFDLNEYVDPNDPVDDFRKVKVTAKIFDIRGRVVRTFPESSRTARHPLDPEVDQWDGRDDTGHIVDGGIYVLRLTVSGSLERATRSFVVVR